MEKSQALVALSALAGEARLDAFRLLVQAGPAGLPAGAVGEALGLPSPTLSFHLAGLRTAGLVTVRRQGRSLIYAAAFPRMNALLAYLTENCCAGAAPCAIPTCPPPHPSTMEIPDEAPAPARLRG